MAFWLKKLRVRDPGARDRVLALLRERGALFLEAAFPHVSSDYPILAGPRDVTRVFDWFRGRGGATPLYISPVIDLVAKATPLVDTNTSAGACAEEMTRALEKHSIVVQVSPPDTRPTFLVLTDDAEWLELSARLPPGTGVRGYDAFALRGRRSSLVVWAE